MPRKLDRFTAALSALFLLAVLLACKKKPPVPSTTSSVAAAPAPPTAQAPAVPADPIAPTASGQPAAAARLPDVKRYPDKEKAQAGAARVLENGVKVFSEADDKTAELATLDKDLLVFRLANIPDWELVEFPSGLGKVSPGWVQAKLIDTKNVAPAQRDAVAKQSKQGAPSAASAGAPKPASSAPLAGTTKPAPSSSTSAADRFKAFRDARAKAKAAAAASAGK